MLNNLDFTFIGKNCSLKGDLIFRNEKTRDDFFVEFQQINSDNELS